MPPIIDSHMGMPGGAPGGGTIPLATLIDYIVQRTYHELTVLSELLPRKTDMERKVEIVQFASRTRQLFIRLLALVKWASSATKVDKCSEICSFLENQSMWFVETADMLAKMARETLVNARLPTFSLPCAIDVLTLGTYPRLPSCIRDKIVPPDAITSAEKRQTLQRLTQVIQYRLVATDLPQQMRKLKVENGRVKFHVEHEFEATLTLMGDSPKIPWRLLDISLLVEDPETGDGKSLVHSLQINYIHQLVQSRLMDNERPLHDLYRVLHTFCLSLQLEVLHSQTQRLIKDRMGDSICVEKYDIGKCLSVSYWRDPTRREKSQEALLFRLSVHVAEDDDGRPLQISHFPSMSVEESSRVGLAIKSNHLSMERLLIQTIEVRGLVKLKDLAKDLQKFTEGACEIRDLPNALHVPLLEPSMESEKLRVMVDCQRGNLLASIPAAKDVQEVEDLEDALNGDRKSLDRLIRNLRLRLCVMRCEKSAQYLPTTCQKHLSFINLTNHPLEKISKSRLYIRVPKQSTFYLVVELLEGDTTVNYKYYLLDTTQCTVDGSEIDISDDPCSKLYLKAGRLIPLDVYSFIHGPFTKIYDEQEQSNIESKRRKRKIMLGELREPPVKKTKGHPYFSPELAYILASCEERIPLVNLGLEFEKNGVVHTGVQADCEGTCFCLSLLSMPDVEGLGEGMCDMVKKVLLSIKVRILSKPMRNWIVEFLFSKPPLESSNRKEQGPVQRVHIMMELNIDNLKKVVKDILDEWAGICHLYSIVHDFAEMYTDVRTELGSTVDIYSYDYRKLSMLYGPNRTSLINIQWKGDAKQFNVTLGTVGSSTTVNPHTILLSQFQRELNHTRSLAQICQVLHETWAPMSSINKLSMSLVQAAATNVKQPMQSFTVIPQSTTHVRIAFRNISCIDVHFRSNKIVSVRDGAYSLFDNSKAVDGFSPTSMFKHFLNKYVDDAITGRHTHRMSTTEDDNPPSPMDSIDIFSLSSQPPSTGSPASRQRETGLRFPMTPPSNPHTPASPSAARISGVTPSPSTALIGTPSPSTLLNVGSPGNPQLHVPSPGSSAFVPAPSPQSLGIHMQSPASGFMGPQGLDVGSPFTSASLAMPSPVQRNWPNSPSVSGPSPASRHTAHSPGNPALHSPQTQVKDGDHSKSTVLSHTTRMLPQRAWAASIPTLLSHDAFDTLLTPNRSQSLPYTISSSPLERFLGSVYLRRNLPRLIQSESLTPMRSTDPNIISFKVETLQFHVSFSNNLQSLHMNVQSVPEHRDQWSMEVLNIIQQYFDSKVACPPYKVNALRAFCRILETPIRILKDCVQLMRLELMGPNQSSGMKWSMQWCLTVPPQAAFVAPAGTAAVAKNKQIKMLLMIQFTRIQPPSGQEPQSIIVPLLYDISANTIQHMDPVRGQPQTPAYMAVSQLLQNFYHAQSAECILYPAVQHIMTNLNL
ncbi:mediator of RNA polymerase II transcription subunit 14-like isoform X3 [Saccostrea cucullata]|uniref:mediator of RNA polymerase II transcription subunit 14-like isoform X3 n=1 Tax=Saccostrea cuccullata TaxID=36930 RepID=UPI002ED3DEB1